MKLSRQFRNKNDEYFEFDVVTTSSPESVGLGMGVESSNMSPFSKHRIDWGDGSNQESLDSTIKTHSYSSAGTYTLRIWTREKYRNINSVLFSPVVNITSLDYSDFRWLREFRFPINGSVGLVTMPTDYEGFNGLRWSSVGCNLTLSNPTLDLSLWNSRIDGIFHFGGITNINRVKIPSNNGSAAQFYWLYSLEAVGPNADNPSNYEADFTNYKITGQFALQGTNTYPNSISLPASAFSSGGASNSFRIGNTGITTLDLSNLIMSSSSGLSLSLFANTSLVSVTWPISYGTGTFSNISAYGCTSYTGSWDFSWANLQNSVSILIFQTSASSIILPSSSATVRQISAYSGNITSINITSMPNMTEIDDFQLRMENNNMSASEVNKILVDLDTNSTGGWANRSINLSGSNAAPDSSSGGFDGISARTSLISKNFTVTTS